MTGLAGDVVVGYPESAHWTVTEIMSGPMLQLAPHKTVAHPSAPTVNGSD